MRPKSTLSTLREIQRLLTMETARFNDICRPNLPPLFRDGTPVTESNVTEFICERTALWRHSWLQGPLAEVIARLEAQAQKKATAKRR